eukprot:COSAG01_NODE_6751_length_3515_cov_3.095141_5_plen_153_part_00
MQAVSTICGLTESALSCHVVPDADLHHQSFRDRQPLASQLEQPLQRRLLADREEYEHPRRQRCLLLAAMPSSLRIRQKGTGDPPSHFPFSRSTMYSHASTRTAPSVLFIGMPGRRPRDLPHPERGKLYLRYRTGLETRSADVRPARVPAERR